MPPTVSSNVVAFPRRPRDAGAPRPLPRTLWELPAGALCPVIGGCLSIEALREALGDLIESADGLPAFDLHVVVVGFCHTRNAVSERLQDRLDAVHVQAIDAIARVEAADGLAAAWGDALAGGAWSGMLWAVLTHGACSDALAERLLRDVHMAQHGAHAALAEERDRVRALAVENGLLHARLQQLLREAAAPRRAAPSHGLARRWLAAVGLVGAAG